MTAGLCTLGDDNIRKVIDNPLLLELVAAPAHAASRPGRPGPGRGRSHGVLHRQGLACAALPADEVGRGGRSVPRFPARRRRGYRRQRCFTSSQVRAIDDALRPIDIDTLRTRFDPADMDRLDIYPGGWPEGGLDFSLEYYPGLKEFGDFSRKSLGKAYR